MYIKKKEINPRDRQKILYLRAFLAQKEIAITEEIIITKVNKKYLENWFKINEKYDYLIDISDLNELPKLEYLGEIAESINFYGLTEYSILRGDTTFEEIGINRLDFSSFDKLKSVLLKAKNETENIILKVFTDPKMPFLVEQKLNQGKLGEVILNALLQFETGIQGDLKDLSESLSTLNLIGLNNTARRSALTHLVLLNEKQSELIVNKSNKNDIRKILGNPSTKSKFDDDVWIYIERKQTQSRLKNLGKMKIYKNDILVLEIDKYGLLKKKSFYNLKDMNEIKIVSETTKSGLLKNRFIYDFMSSMRQKVNDPLGQRAKKRKEANQR